MISLIAIVYCGFLLNGTWNQVSEKYVTLNSNKALLCMDLQTGQSDSTYHSVVL